jgi:hypothetical protein
MRQLSVESVKSVPGVLELGPKRTRGGAARVFMLQEYDGAFFLSAAVEKGSGGATGAIQIAAERSSAIKLHFSRYEAREEALERLGREMGYRLFR